MAAPILRYHNRRNLRRNRIFRDRTHPLEVYDDDEVIRRFRLPRHVILQLTVELTADLELTTRTGSLTPLLPPHAFTVSEISAHASRLFLFAWAVLFEQFSTAYLSDTAEMISTHSLSEKSDFSSCSQSVADDNQPLFAMKTGCNER